MYLCFHLIDNDVVIELTAHMNGSCIYLTCRYRIG